MKVKNPVSQNIRIFPKINHRKDLQNRKVRADGRGIHVNHSMPGDLFQGHSCPEKCKVWPQGEGLAAGRCDLDPVSAALPRPTRDSAMEPVLKRSYMKHPQWRDCRCCFHMPQEPLKLFQWDRRPALEHVQAVQHRLSTFLREACCLFDQIQLHTEKIRSSASGRVCSFPSWPEGPTGWGARAPSHCVRTTDPETELIWASRRSSWSEDTGWQGEPEGQDLVLICSSFERKPQEWSVAWKDRNMKVHAFRSIAANQSRGWMHPKMRFCMSILNGSLWRAEFKTRRSKIGYNEVRAVKLGLHISWRDWLYPVIRQ